MKDLYERGPVMRAGLMVAVDHTQSVLSAAAGVNADQDLNPRFFGFCSRSVRF